MNSKQILNKQKLKKALPIIIGLGVWVVAIGIAIVVCMVLV